MKINNAICSGGAYKKIELSEKEVYETSLPKLYFEWYPNPNNNNDYHKAILHEFGDELPHWTIFPIFTKDVELDESSFDLAMVIGGGSGSPATDYVFYMQETYVSRGYVKLI